MDNKQIGQVRQKVIASSCPSLGTSYIEKGKGALLYDVEGREYIDFAGGIAVMNVGHSHPKVVAAIKTQAEKMTHTCFMVMPYESPVRLAERLVALAPGDSPKKVMFMNSGAEAVENAVKAARYYSKKAGVIAFENGFHGRTLLTMTLTSKVKPYKFGFGPYAPEVYRMPYAYCYRCPMNLEYPGCNAACADLLEDFLTLHTAPENTAALVIEPVAGEGGFIAPPDEYFQKLAGICRKHDILFIADEVQTGIGRCGTMFAMEQTGVEPDITVLAKSLAAGMPLSAVIAKREILDAVHPSGLGGTYGANPVACEAAGAVLDVFEQENLLERAETIGDTLEKRFVRFQEKFSIIGDVRGRGAMMAMELVRDRKTKEPAPDEAKQLVSFCMENGLVLLACGCYGNVIRVLMPLVIKEEELEKGLAVMEKGFEKLSQ